MLLQPGYLTRFLTHKTDEVRNKIARFFIDTKYQSNELISESIKALNYFGVEKNVPIIRLLAIQNLSADNINELFKILENIGNKEEFANSRYFLSHLFLEQPIDLLKEATNFPAIFIKLIKNEKKKGKAKYKSFEDKIKSYSIDELWNELNHFIESNINKYNNEVDLNHGHLIIEKMMSLEHTKYDLFIKQYFESFKSDQPWLKWYLYAYTASKFNLKDCFPDIIKCYQYDETFQMLSLINPIILENINQDNLSFIKDEFISGNNDYQIALCSILKEMVFENTESIILELFKFAKDDMVKLNLCIALDDIFSLEFIQNALNIVNEGYDRQVIHLEEELLLYSIISGKEIPEIGEFADEYLRREKKELITK